MAAPAVTSTPQVPSSPPHNAESQKTAFKIGTRKSALALAQTDLLTNLLSKSHPHLTFTPHPTSTMGDKKQTTALHAFNAKSLWTFELENQLLAGETDFIAHSLKDMPTQLPAGCALGAACLRTEKRDCVVMSAANAAKGWKPLSDLPAGSVVGTSSVRRIAQLRRLFPALEIEDVRGNINTRLAKLDEARTADGTERYAALILAATGLQRIGLGNRVSSFLSWREGGWLGPVGQGALGVEVREGDKDVAELCQALMADGVDQEGESKRTWFEALAERMLLRTLEGGCSVPLGVETEWVQGSELGMHALVMSVDGMKEVRGYRTATISSKEEAEGFGLAMARELVEKGAEEILKEITLNRKVIEDAGGA